MKKLKKEKKKNPYRTLKSILPASRLTGLIGSAEQAKSFALK